MASNTMRGVLTAFGVSAALFSINPALAQQNASAGRVGVLTCNVGAGTGMIITSTKALSCRFQPSDKRIPTETYVGTIKKYGLDIGSTSRGRLSWAVLAPSNTLRTHALAGEYVGAAAQVTAGAGAGANLLVGGFERTINLQPLSVETQSGANLALGVAAMDLEPATVRAPTGKGTPMPK